MDTVTFKVQGFNGVRIGWEVWDEQGLVAYGIADDVHKARAAARAAERVCSRLEVTA